MRPSKDAVRRRGGEAGGFLKRSGSLVSFSLRRARALLVPSGFLESVFGEHGLRAIVLPNIGRFAKPNLGFL